MDKMILTFCIAFFHGLAVWERGEQVMLPTSDFSEASDLVFHSFHPERWWNMSWINIQVKNCWEGSKIFVALPDGEAKHRLSQACVKSYMAKGGEAPDMRYNSGDPKMGKENTFHCEVPNRGAEARRGSGIPSLVPVQLAAADAALKEFPSSLSRCPHPLQGVLSFYFPSNLQWCKETQKSAI